MRLVTIATKSLRQRALASSLTAFSVALGVMLMVIVLVLHGVLERNFRQNNFGYDMIVGPKGSDLQLVLSTVYRIGNPEGLLPYRVYREMQNDPRITEAVPIAMGDVTEEGGFKIIGTTSRYFELEYADGREFYILGKAFGTDFDAIIGADVARDNRWGLGSKLKLVHGGLENKDGHTHDEEFTVVGILKRTGTANDKTVFVNLEGFFAIGGHDTPLDEAIGREIEFFGNTTLTEREIERLRAEELEEAKAHAPGAEGHAHHHHHATPDVKKFLTAVFIKTRNQAVAYMLGESSRRGSKAMYVNPQRTIQALMINFVGKFRTLLFVLTGLIIIVSGVGIFVSIYNSMSDRKKEIAIMRALGARRSTVFTIILAESFLLCVGGGALGLFLGHGLLFVAAPTIEMQSGLLMSRWAFETVELVIFPVLMGLAGLIGLLPALTAYRTDVARTLAS